MGEERRKSKMPIFLMIIVILVAVVAIALVVYLTNTPKEETQAIIDFTASTISRLAA